MFEPVSRSVALDDLTNLIAQTYDGIGANVAYSSGQLQMANERITALEFALDAIQYNLKEIATGSPGRLLATDEGLRTAKEVLGSPEFTD